jgi:hypothetical protein
VSAAAVSRQVSGADHPNSDAAWDSVGKPSTIFARACRGLPDKLVKDYPDGLIVM